MKRKHTLELIFFSCLLLRCTSAADDNCLPASCGPAEPVIRFPFRITGRQPSWCGFPGFDLNCDKRNRTIIRLPSSRSYTVNRISYLAQVIYIDPDFCRLNEISKFSLANTPFDSSSLRSYTFFNCSLRNLSFTHPAVRIPCLSNSSANYSVIAGRTGLFPLGNMPSNCKVLMTAKVPVRLNGDVGSELELMWLTPSCRSSEMEGRACGSMADDAQTETGGCGFGSGCSTDAKYGLSLGIGVPLSIFLIGLAFYVASRARDHSETHQQGIDFFSIAIIAQSPSRTGLDESTIESYPKTMLGESCRLPDDDRTCAICLSDYKPKESLRTIPECNHYFHADCIDEWLKGNATCPVCRNTLESSSLVTPCSITSTNSVDTS